MLEKLAKQTAIYGISTIVVRFLNYLLTPYYTRIFDQATYGIVTDIYALIPFALVLLSMGMESSYFRFSTRAEEEGGDVAEGKRRVFATTWGVTMGAAALFFLVVLLLLRPICLDLGRYDSQCRYLLRHCLVAQYAHCKDYGRGVCGTPRICCDCWRHHYVRCGDYDTLLATS